MRALMEPQPLRLQRPKSVGSKVYHANDWQCQGRVSADTVPAKLVGMYDPMQGS